MHRRSPRSRGAGRLACLAIVLAAASCGDGDGSQAAHVRPPPSEDPRLDYLLAPCAKSSHYDVDTSRPVAILIEVLERGQRDPLKRARMELAGEGPEALVELRRLVDRGWNDPQGVNPIRNALDALSHFTSREATDLVRRVLEHPDENLRIAALRVLRHRGDPGDYDAVHELLGGASPEFVAEIVTSLHELDPERAALEFSGWMEAGQARALWPELAPAIAVSKAPRVLERACELWPDLEAPAQLFVAAACARSGDERALDFVRQAQRGGDPSRRHLAIRALAAAGLMDELHWSVREDPSAELRLLAAAPLCAPGVAEEQRDVLEAATSDPHGPLRSAALEALARAGEPSAIERGIDLVSDPRPGSLDLAVRLLRPAWNADEALARRALERLLSRYEQERARPLAENAGLFEAIGSLPLRAAAEFLYGISRGAEGGIQGIPAHRWLMLQVGNTGEPGQRLLAEALAEETGELRRIDMLEGLTAAGGAWARDRLLELVSSGDLSPYELLFAADRLTRMGPARLVAPALKRATLRVSQPDVRVALQCLLWRWYPQPQAR